MPLLLLLLLPPPHAAVLALSVLKNTVAFTGLRCGASPAAFARSAATTAEHPGGKAAELTTLAAPVPCAPVGSTFVPKAASGARAATALR